MSRTITVVVTNHTGEQLEFVKDSATSDEGPIGAPVNGQKTVAPGGTFSFTARNTSLFNGGNKGTFQLANANKSLLYVIFFTHPQLSGTTYVQVQSFNTNPGGPPNSLGPSVGTYYQVYTGDPVTSAVNVYKGIRANAFNENAYVVPLAADPYAAANNCTDMTNAMFYNGVRLTQVVEAAYDQGTTVPYAPADFSGGQMAAIVDALYRSWTDRSGADWPILQFLQNYIYAGKDKPVMQMWVPKIKYHDKNGDGASVFNISGYQSFSLCGSDGVWNQSGVRTFLQLLAGGGHFAAISANKDFANQDKTNDGRDLYSSFLNSGLIRRGDLVNSHYATVGNTTGYYYLDITEDASPQNCGLLLSLLFGRTVNGLGQGTPGDYNTFMQLEGWQAEGSSKSTRHNIDYAAYNKTLWNTSTFGACPYSEKRATTIFLAPPSWTPQLYTITGMMPYVGAYATSKGQPQDWLNTAMFRIPVDAPVLPEKYYD
jgi:hypothetical protein